MQKQQNNNDTIFNLRSGNMDNLILTTSSEYKDNEMVTCSKFKVLGRIFEIFKQFDDFDWTNVMFAGGLLAGLMEEKYNEDKFKRSDIDLYITTKSDFMRVYNYFKDKLQNMYSFSYNFCSVVTILSKNCSRPIQLILYKDNKKEILNNFDLSYCQVGFDGNDFIYTNDYINSVKTRITSITSNKLHAYRIIKTLEKGFSIKLPQKTNKIYIKNYFDSYSHLNKNDITVQFQTDKNRDIYNLDLDELKNNNIVKQNLNKCFVPDHNDTDQFIIDNIKKFYPNPIIIKDNDINHKDFNFIFNSNYSVLHK